MSPKHRHMLSVFGKAHPISKAASPQIIACTGHSDYAVLSRNGTTFACGLTIRSIKDASFSKAMRFSS